jgi:hypothetical protein
MQWIDFLGKYYKEQKAKNPEYKYKDAMSDAVGPYRNQGSEAPSKKRKMGTKKSKGGKKGGRTKKRR